MVSKAYLWAYSYDSYLGLRRALGLCCLMVVKEGFLRTVLATHLLLPSPFLHYRTVFMLSKEAVTEP